MTRKLLTRLAAGSAACLIAAPAFAQTLTIENFVGTVEIVPGSALKVDGAERIDISGDDITVDHGIKLKNTSCYSWNGRDPQIKINGKKAKISDYPTLRVTAPSDTHLVIRDSLLYGSASDLGSTDISLSSCGKLDLSNVDGLMKARLSGSADIDAETVGSADLGTTGSGDYLIERVRGAALFRTTGSGDYEIGRLDDGVEFKSSGSGDLEIGTVMGDVDITTSGSGDVKISEGEVGRMTVKTTGSGDVMMGGVVGDIEAYTTGSGDIYASAHTGKIKTRKTGSGDVVVGSIEIR